MTHQQPIRVAILRYAGAQEAAIQGLRDLFLVAHRMAASAGREHLPDVQVTCWEQDEAGHMRPEGASAEDAQDAPDAVVVPPALQARTSSLLTPVQVEWLKAWQGSGCVFCSVCAGAFGLAEAGLLDGRTVTTHWHLADALAAAFPSLHVDSRRMIVDDGDVVTAGGLMAWTDLGLTLVSRWLGPVVASETAHFLVVDLSRVSQQSFSHFTPPMQHGDAAILAVQQWLQGCCEQGWSLAEMAQRAGLGERTFLRRFHGATGLTPTEYVQALRMMRAREQLEFTQLSIDRVAWEVGYRDAGAFRKVFRRWVGVSPGEYRRRFGVGRSFRRVHGPGPAVTQE